VGAVQAQHWPAVPVALWSRVEGFAVEDLRAALERRDLVAGSLIRNTLHLVSAREHPAYAAVTAESGADDWRRTKAEPGAGVDGVRQAILEYARDTPRSGAEIAELVEGWVGEHPDALDAGEVEHQRKVKWRPFLRWSSLVRAPADGTWGAKAPSSLLAAPAGDAGDALAEVVKRHLRAFGPAGPEDVAGWIGWRTPPVREALERLDLERVEDEDGRALYDLPGAPRPDGDAEAPPRLLAAFDSALLAYAPKHRARILPPDYQDAVYERANLRIRPSFLADGLVAGTWSSEVKRREAVVTLRPLQKLTRAQRAALADEAERLARAVHPAAKGHGVAFD
jgi:winged helix DNA-binding protein